MQTRIVKTESGFSLFELIIAMSITLTVMGLASTLLASHTGAMLYPSVGYRRIATLYLFRGKRDPNTGTRK